MGGNNDNVASPESVPIHLKISLCICILQTDWLKLSSLDHRIKNMLSFVFLCVHFSQATSFSESIHQSFVL